jgi:hypothetical protein
MNNDSEQVRCVNTKTQEIKDDVKEYLQGVIDGKELPALRLELEQFLISLQKQQLYIRY